MQQHDLNSRNELVWKQDKLSRLNMAKVGLVDIQVVYTDDYESTTQNLAVLLVVYSYYDIVYYL